MLALWGGRGAPGRGSVRVGVRARALLPQDPKALFAEETVVDELMEWAAVGGYAEREAREMLGRIGLAARVQAHPYDLSGGQRQFLALAKVLLVKPRL